MNEHLKREFDAWALCRQDVTLEGTYPLSDITPHVQCLASSSGDVHLELRFTNSEGKSFVSIDWQTSVKVSCERCLEPFSMDLSASNTLVLCRTDQAAAQVEEPYEPWILEKEMQFCLTELLAEEILLAMPLVPRHEKESCTTNMSDYAAEKTENTHKPFAELGLKQLL